MSENRYTEVTRLSWFSRIGGAIKGIVVGLILVAISFPLLFLNEGRAVKREKTLKEGAGAVVSASSDSVDAANENKLIHVTGKTATDAVLTDKDFGVTVNALKLRRIVEMYQWEETKETSSDSKVGGSSETTTTYSYKKVWSDELIKSSEFKRPEGRSNPLTMPFASNEWISDQVTLGSYTLSDSLLAMINSYQAHAVAADTPLPTAVQDKGRITQEGGYYIGADPANPAIGDIRVRFEVVNPGDISVIAKQTKNTFESYTTEVGGSILLLESGIHSAEEMFNTAQKSNTMMTWALRLVGFILMFAGFSMLLRPLVVLADVLPILGNIVGAGVGLVAGLLAAALSFVTIAIAWIAYRPILGCLLLAVAVAATILLKGKLKKPSAAA